MAACEIEHGFVHADCSAATGCVTCSGLRKIGFGTSSLFISRDNYTFGSVYDLWLAVVERWLTSHGHVLGGFVRFYGEDPGDRGIITVDGRLILMSI